MTRENYTRLEDMSETERQSWATLIVDVCVFVWFLKMTTGGIGRFENRVTEASDLVGIMVGVIITTAILHAIIGAIFEWRKSKDHTTEKDERDLDIMRRGASAGFWVLTIAINIIAFTLLLEYSADTGAQTFWESFSIPLSVLSPPSMFFALMVTAFLGDIIKNATMVLAYRGS